MQEACAGNNTCAAGYSSRLCSLCAAGHYRSGRGCRQCPPPKSLAMLLAGLAGLGRVADAEIAEYGERLGIDLAAQTRWTRMIERAAEVDNPALVAMLAGLGMQGSGWDRMTARHLFHIVSALRRVGLEAEARMIAAEAVARA